MIRMHRYNWPIRSLFLNYLFLTRVAAMDYAIVFPAETVSLAVEPPHRCPGRVVAELTDAY